MKTKGLRMAFILLFIVLFFQLSAQVTITGRVTGNDAPDGLVGAAITLVAEDNNYDAQSGANGSFTIQNVLGTPEGIQYELTITYEGYVPHISQRQVVVQEGPPPPPINWGIIRIDEYYWQPYDVIAIEDTEEQVVDLMWEAPLVPEEIEERWIHFDDGVNAGDVGAAAGTPMQYAVAIRYTSAQLAELNLLGLYVTSVRFFPFPIDPVDPPVIYTIQVHTGGSIEGAVYNPGFLAASQVPENVIPGQWNEVIIEQPVYLEPGQEVWIGYHLNSPTGRGAGASDNPRVDDHGDLIYWGASWTSLNRLAPAIERNWNIQAYTGFARGDRSFAIGLPRQVEMTQSTLESGYNYNTYEEITAVSFDYSTTSVETRSRRIADRNSRPPINRRLEGYYVFRFSEEDANDPELWTQLGELIDRTAHRDTAWDQLPVGYYRYAVQAVYTGNVLSRFAYSDLLATSLQGDGTAENPYQIDSAAALNMVRDFIGIQNQEVHFIQTRDIDLGVAPWNEEQGWVPIGSGTSVTQNHATAFCANYNGNGHIIRNLTINRPGSHAQALFGTLDGSGTVTKLGMLDVDIIGNNHVGSIVGYMAGMNSRIEQCFVTGRVQAVNNVGGIAGRKGCNQGGTQSLIFDCYSTAHVIATAGTVSTYAGGITGYQYRGETRRSYATGMVELGVPSNNAGAVVGRRGGGTLSELVWNIQTTGQTAACGNVEFPGHTTMQLMQQASYGGFNFNDIWRIDAGESYAYFQWEGEEAGEHNLPPPLPPTNLTTTDGIEVVDLSWSAPPPEMGVPDGYNVYRDGQRINQQLIIPTQYRDEDLENWRVYTYYVTAVYGEEESGPSTSVRAVPYRFAGGEGTVENPWLVETPIQFFGIRYKLNNHFRQVSDISLDEWANWVPLADLNNRFRGTYDGDGRVITDMVMTTSGAYAGLFGYADGATIKNLGLVEVNLQNLSTQSGALGGTFANTTVINCYVTGFVSTRSNYTGGFIGYTNGGQIIDSWADVEFVTTSGQGGAFIGVANSTIRNCFTLGSATTTRNLANADFGGFIGWARGSISDSFSRAAVVTGGEIVTRVGSFVGQNAAAITNCYATGRLTAGEVNCGGLLGTNTGAVTNSYWDMETTGYDVSAGGEGRATRQMIYPYDEDNTYVRWDFDEIWSHDPTRTLNNGYPMMAYIAPEVIDTPEVAVSIVTIENVKHIRIQWESVTNALSYKIFASGDPYAEDWGDPIRILGEDATHYTEAITDGEKKFFRLVASSVPEE